MYLNTKVIFGYNKTVTIEEQLKNKEFLQNFRWPALKEIIIKNNYARTGELEVLGVKIKYVPA